MDWAVRGPNTIGTCPVTRLSGGVKSRTACIARKAALAPRQPRVRPLEIWRGCTTDGHGGGGRGFPGAFCGSGDDDDPRKPDSRRGGADWARLVLLAATPVLALYSLVPANAVASEPSAAQPLMDSLQQQDSNVRGYAEGSHSGTTGTTGAQRSGEVLAIKRLLREVFADVVNIKQQLQDLMPRYVMQGRGACLHAGGSYKHSLEGVVCLDAQQWVAQPHAVGPALLTQSCAQLSACKYMHTAHARC
eukprot:1155460-Pelagomonas_calceolata.AAC.2